MIDYKNSRYKEQAMVPRWVAISYAAMGVAAWLVCLVIVQKFC